MEKLPSTNLKAEALSRLVARARQDAFFVGRALAIYQKLHGMDDQHMAQWLECSEDDLARLALCRLPDDKKDGSNKTSGRSPPLRSATRTGWSRFSGGQPPGTPYKKVTRSSPMASCWPPGTTNLTVMTIHPGPREVRSDRPGNHR